MLRLLLTTALLLLFTACTENHLLVETLQPSKPHAISSKIISKLAIPVRENGYKDIKTQIIKTQSELDNLTRDIEEQNGWSKKESFLETLLLKEIDFNNYNLLLYRITESSSSTILSVDVPLGDKENIIINIGRDKPETSTSDMAYYILAYKISKNIKNITFDNGIKKDTIKNNTIEKETP